MIQVLILGLMWSIVTFWTGTAMGLRDYGTVQNAIWRGCYDADTCKFDIPDWPPIVGKAISIRVYGIDTPEIRGKCQAEKDLAIQARDYVREVMKRARKIELRSMRRGKYFRIIADVYLDGARMANMLILLGHARPYYGKGPREGWCDAEL